MAGGQNKRLSATAAISSGFAVNILTLLASAVLGAVSLIVMRRQRPLAPT